MGPTGPKGDIGPTGPTGPGADIHDIPQNQMTVTLVKDAVTNINNYPSASLNNYSAVYNTDTYPYYDILYQGNTCTEEQAQNYMEYMTGSRFLPVYDYDKPKNSLFVMADKSI